MRRNFNARVISCMTIFGPFIVVHAMSSLPLRLLEQRTNGTHIGFSLETALWTRAESGGRLSSLGTVIVRGVKCLPALADFGRHGARGVSSFCDGRVVKGVGAFIGTLPYNRSNNMPVGASRGVTKVIIRFELMEPADMVGFFSSLYFRGMEFFFSSHLILALCGCLGCLGWADSVSLLGVHSTRGSLRGKHSIGRRMRLSSIGMPC